MKWKKKVLSLLLAMCLTAGMLPMAAFAVDEPQTRTEQANDAALPFTDVSEDDWFYPYVKYAYEHGLMSGTSATTFGPQVAVNRAMVVQILYAQAGKPAVSGESSFSDVYEGDWYYDAVVWAEQVGVTAGEDGRFNPNTNITREQFALMLYAYIGKPEVSGDLTGFADAAQVSSWAKTGMTWACQNQLFSGEEYNGERYLNPQGQTTRAQAATILKAFCENVIAGMEEEENANYAITDLVVEGQNVTITVSAEQVCTVQVEFLDEDTEQALNVTASAAVPAETELGTVTATTSALLPEHFIARAYLLDADGNQLCNSFTSIKYTSKYEAFAAQTVDDFAEEQVVSFTGETDNNFGVLADGVVTETAVAGQNVIAENEDGTYTVTNIDESVQALQPGDEALFYDANGEEVLLSISTITISGTTATIVRDTEATLQDFYQVLKVDMSVGAEPENVDTSEVEGVQLLNRASDGTMEEETRTDQKNIEIIDEDIDLCQTVEFGLEYELKYFKTGGKVSLKQMITIEITYDAKLFGEDYIFCKMQSETSGSIHFEIEAKVDNDESEKMKFEEANVDLGKITFPLGYGFSCSAVLSVPIEVSLEGGVVADATYSIKAGITYSSTDGEQRVGEKSFDVTFIEGRAKFEAKAGPKVALSIEFLKDVLEGEISAQAGSALTAEVSTASADITNAAQVHACSLCLDGDAYRFINVKVKLSYKLSEHLQGTVVNVTLFELNDHLFTFYISVLNDEDSALKGEITFGEGSCPNNKYRTTFCVQNENAEEIAGAQIDVTKGETAVGTVETGEYLYLYNGSYTARSEVENQPLKKDFAVQGAASTVALNTQTDIETDPPDPDPADVVASGTCGENLTWTLDNNGQLLIKGAGEMEDWGSTKETPWYEHRDQITTVYIGGEVTSIGDNAFWGCSSLTSVTIPDSVTSIGDDAFYDCDSLPSVTIPDSVTSIGDWAFGHCESLTSVTIGSGVMSIGSEAFWTCDSLTSVTIPDSVTSIGEEAFYSCDSLSSVTIGSGVTSIGINAFGLCSSLTEITVDTDNAAYSSLEGVLFNKDQTTLVQYPGGKSGAYTI
ncbi:MAG TPA: leucine-rich repeat protein, partial [Candidatus Butyricicoccus stercorigallinarum]|nr:leucine-rich repeat protein [Candidatus Butyricicoccus stercorigallinarum]